MVRDLDNPSSGSRPIMVGSIAHAVTQLSIKHEYAINSVKQDHHTRYLFVKSSEQGLIPVPFATSETWHKTHQKKPSLINSSLRMAMLQALLIEMSQPLLNTKKDEQGDGMDHGHGRLENSRGREAPGGAGCTRSTHGQDRFVCVAWLALSFVRTTICH